MRVKSRGRGNEGRGTEEQTCFFLVGCILLPRRANNSTHYDHKAEEGEGYSGTSTSSTSISTSISTIFSTSISIRTIALAAHVRSK